MKTDDRAVGSLGIVRPERLKPGSPEVHICIDVTVQGNVELARSCAIRAVFASGSRFVVRIKDARNVHGRNDRLLGLNRFIGP